MRDPSPPIPPKVALAKKEFQKLSVIMPVYNEVRTLGTIVDRVLRSPVEIPLELIIVDDGSTDGSRELIEKLARQDSRIRPFFHEENLGKADCIRTGIRESIGDLVLFQDADLEYNPADYAVLLHPMIEGLADVVYGSRFLTGKYRRVLYFWHSIANRILTSICNVLNDITLTDMETGYKLIRADILRLIPLSSTRFAIEPELTTKLAQWNLRIYEVPISYEGRTYYEGKKVGLKDAFHALWAMLKYRFFSRRFTTHDGFYILQSLRRAKGFNRWLFHRIEPYVGQRVLEAGCGIGNLTEFLLNRKELVCIDNDSFYTEIIRRRYGHMQNISVHAIDLERFDDDETLLDSALDTVVCINVLEHVKEDSQTLRRFYELLEPGGHAVLLIPANPRLFTGTDAALGHFRRYTFEEIRNKLMEAGFEVVHLSGFNRLGSLGWYVSGKLLGRTIISPGQMKLFERLLPIAKLVEHVPILPHLSIIAIGRKPATA